MAPGEPEIEETVPRKEALRRERLRLREIGSTDYLWAEKANVMLLPLRGELFQWADGKTTHLTGGASSIPRSHGTAVVSSSFAIAICGRTVKAASAASRSIRRAPPTDWRSS